MCHHPLLKALSCLNHSLLLKATPFTFHSLLICIQYIFILKIGLLFTFTTNKIIYIYINFKLVFTISKCFQVDNIRACLNAADRLGVRLEGVTARDLREGSLKAVLALFFSLSKHKQHLKLQAEQVKQRKHDEMLSR